MPIRFPKLCAAALLMICTAMPFAPHVLAKGKKGKSSATRARGKSSHRTVAKNFHRSGYSYSSAPSSETDYAVVPDEIEVQEYGSSNPSQLARWLSPSREVAPARPAEPILITPTKRQNVRIDSRRVLQIQQALASRGFYTGEMTGVYDEVTIDSMRRFQLANRISVTGYPTAQALKRLGLTSW
jgi:Putative peptidoglycan binding domain